MNIRPAHEIRLGDALTVLRSMESESVQCCVTSPPYFGLRDYGTAEWDISNAEDAEIAEMCDHKGEPKASQLSGLNHGRGRNVYEESATVPYHETCGKCGAVRIDKQIGLEATPAEFVAKMVEVFEEVRRVLKKDGTLWLNLGDSYWTDSPVRKSAKEAFSDTWDKSQTASNGGLRKTAKAFGPWKNKDLIGIPWRVAFALQEAGWWLRQDIIWSKPNPMPESVTDRCTKSHEYIFLLTKSAKYFYDNEAIKERGAGRLDFGEMTSPARLNQGGEWKGVRKSDAIGVNGRSIQTTNSEAERRDQPGTFSNNPRLRPNEGRNRRSVWTIATQPYSEAHFATFPPKLIEPCILAGSREGDTVLDPFNGSGTTGLVSLRHRRNYIGIELNPEYIKIAEKRLSDVQVKLF